MKVDRKKLELAMARVCMDSKLNNAIAGKGIRPSTLGRIAKALGVDPADIMEKEERR